MGFTSINFPPTNNLDNQEPNCLSVLYSIFSKLSYIN